MGTKTRCSICNHTNILNPPNGNPGKLMKIGNDYWEKYRIWICRNCRSDLIIKKLKEIRECRK